MEQTQTKEQSTNQYVDNKKFYEALLDYKKQLNYSKENNLPKPKVSNYIGECFLKIATHLSYKGNFINYSYRDEMVADGIENCLVAVEKFDPEKSTNPFAYYTQIIFFAFVRRIQKEKKQQATKYRMLENVDLEQLISHVEDDDEYVTHLVELMKRQSDLIEPERKIVKSKKGKK